MKSPFLGLRTVIYKVSDLSKAKDWYANVFATMPYFDEPYYVGFSIGGYELGLQPEESTVGEKTKNVVTYWGVNDVNKETDRLVALGAVEVEKPTDVGGDIIVATVLDPWGNAIGLIYNPHFKSDISSMASH
jgi:predicted enzyme related to lactoylglutathione lyase